jgi:hypothetical protein
MSILAEQSVFEVIESQEMNNVPEGFVPMAAEIDEMNNVAEGSVPIAATSHNNLAYGYTPSGMHYTSLVGGMKHIMSIERLPNLKRRITRLNGDIFIGTYYGSSYGIEDGYKITGKGKMTFPDGSYYEGMFQSDLPHGECKFQDVSGGILAGIWFKGTFIGKRRKIDYTKVLYPAHPSDAYLSQNCLFVRNDEKKICEPLLFVTGKRVFYFGETMVTDFGEKLSLDDEKTLRRLPHGEGAMVFSDSEGQRSLFRGFFLGGNPTEGKISLSNGFECFVSFDGGVFYPKPMDSNVSFL